MDVKIQDAVSSLRSKRSIRIALGLILLVNVSFVGSAYLDRHQSTQGPTANTDVGDRIAEANNRTTVIATQGLIPTVEAPRAAISEPNGGLYAIGPSGRVTYLNTTYHSYWDVDPVPDTRASVLYGAAEFVPADECGTESSCFVRHVRVVNLSTGEGREVYTDVASRGRWHDVDRYDEDSLLVANINEDRVSIVNVTSGLIEWSWEIDDDFAPSSGGGDFGGDWAHINDVELLPDGRIMADLRDQDVVVFLDPETGLQENWTLGSDDDYDTLNEQHNPDYIPESHGGPAVVVADSMNNRIVEYQRMDGRWEQSWVWQDARMNWPRDADRLPNGNTLITDSRSDRVFEIDEDGTIVWSVTADNPYEAERLGTGDESRNGESATRLGLESRTADEGGDASIGSALLSLIPGVVMNAILFVKPAWMRFYHIGASVVVVGVLLVWPALEVYWSAFGVDLRNPVVLNRE